MKTEKLHIEGNKEALVQNRAYLASRCNYIMADKKAYDRKRSKREAMRIIKDYA